MRITKLINFLLFLYVLTLYIFTYREGYHIISNFIALLLVITIWINVLFNRKKIQFNKYLFWFFIFICISTITYFIALDQILVIGKLKTLILLYILSFSIINYIGTYKQIITLISYIVISGFIASIYIYWSSDVNFSISKRYGDILGNQNAIGIIISIAIIFAFFLIIFHKKYVYIPMLISMIPVVFMTGSRKSLFLMLFNLVLIIYMLNRGSFNKKVKSLILISLVFFIGFYLAFYVPIFYNIIGYRLENLFNFIIGKSTNEMSINSRSNMISYGLQFWERRPLFGFGIDNFRYLFSKIPEGWNTYSHNNYIELLVGTGIIGLIVYYMTHIVIFNQLIRLNRRKGFKMINFLFISIIFSYMILSPSLVYYDSKHFTLLLSIASLLVEIKH